MTYFTFFGGLFISLSPVVASFATFHKVNLLIVLSLGGAFFWLIACLTASLWWFVIEPVMTYGWFAILFDVLFQEGFRFLFATVFSFMRTRLGPIAKDLPPALTTAFAVGTGWAAVHVLVTYVAFLWKSTGPGDLLSDACPQVSVFIINGVLTMLMSLVNILLTVLMVDGVLSKKWYLVILCFVFHYAASYMSLISSSSCVGAMLPMFFVVVVITATVLYFVSRSQFIKKI